MKESSIIDLIDDENLENALSLREKYIENAALPKKTVILQNLKRISAACLAVLFLMLPASVFLIHKDQASSSHAYFLIITEEKFSFQELNNILGAEHLYNKLSEEYNTYLQIQYTWKESQTWNNLVAVETLNAITNGIPSHSLNSAVNAYPAWDLTPSPISAEIRQRYQNEERTDFLHLLIFFGETDNDHVRETDVLTVVNGVSVRLTFPEANIPFAQASFVHQNNLYILNLVSTGGTPDIDHYLEILLGGENP